MQSRLVAHVLQQERERERERESINSYRWPMFCNMLEFIDQLAYILANRSISTHTCMLTAYRSTADIYLVHTHLRHVRMLPKEPAIAHSQPAAV
jgi:uncharacterized protein YueI